MKITRNIDLSACVTCANWIGSAGLEQSDSNHIKFDSSARGKCPYKAGPKTSTTPACSEYRSRFDY